MSLLQQGHTWGNRISSAFKSILVHAFLLPSNNLSIDFSLLEVPYFHFLPFEWNSAILMKLTKKIHGGTFLYYDKKAKCNFNHRNLSKELIFYYCTYWLNDEGCLNVRGYRGMELYIFTNKWKEKQIPKFHKLV